MELDDIRKLIDLMEERGLAELELKNRLGEVRLVRNGARPVHAAEPVASPAAAPVEAPASNPVSPEPVEPGLAIRSPMVGTFYRAPNPEAEPYIEIGSVVEKGAVVCIIEAMKMMNEIQAEQRGRVTRILVENAEPVEYEQPLFVLEPV